jgi:glycosyltransferase involved in cell wall biosynthesis
MRHGNDAPAVSVVIPCYNYADFLPEAICSVVAQTCDDWEIVVVNDGSEDDSAQVAREIAADFRYLRQRICVLDISNSGVSTARNTGIAASRGRYVLPLDADDVIAPTMLEKTVALLDSCPEISIAYTDMYGFGPNIASQPIEFPDYDFELLCQQMNYFYCALTRRGAWEAAGGYDPELPALEDWEFAINCGKLGCVARRIPEPLFGARRKPTGLHTQVLSDNVRLRAQIVRKHAELYSPVTRAWADAILGEGLAAGAPDEILACTRLANSLGAAYLALDRAAAGLAGDVAALRAELDRCRREHAQGRVLAQTAERPDANSALARRWLAALHIGGRRATRAVTSGQDARDAAS